jgi:hypothetical protein
MTTGYTQSILKGISFNEFVLLCARAFGACVTMRDESFNTPIPEKFEPRTNYYVKKIEENRRELSRIVGLSTKELESEVERDYQEKVEQFRGYIAKSRDLREKYEAMLYHVTQWNPPTDDHIGLKDFMVNQIRESIKFDCSNDYYLRNWPIKKSRKIWKQERISELEGSIEYNTEQLAQEIKQTNNRNEWIQQLRNSLT